MATAETGLISSTSPSPGLAPQACLGCRTRKKGCDKKLPSCSHCSHRSVICHYVAPTVHNQVAEFDVAGTRPLSCTEDATFWSSPAGRESSPSTCLSIKPSMMLMNSFSSALPAQFQLNTQKLAEPMTFDEILHLQVGRIIWVYGKYVDEISIRYFHGIHRWLPVISRQRFNDRLCGFRGRATADFSILLLSMCLITSHPSADTKGRKNDQETLYLTTKMLFAQVQALLTTSTNLVQACLLIATYEHGHGLTDAAYISIGICARMAFIAGLQKTKLNRSPRDIELWLKEEEERNLWWGILLSERFIMSETTSTDKSLATQLPDIDECLPLDIDLAQQSSKTEVDSIWHQPVYAFNSETVGSFGREVQAAYLYAWVLEVMKIEDPVAQRVELSQLDSNLQSFFTKITSQSGTTWGLYCGSIAFTVRALFTLHEYIISHSGEIVELDFLHKSSKAAINTLAKMVVDVARSFNERTPGLDIEILPPRASNFVRAACYLLSTSDDVDSKECCADINEIQTMLRYLSQRWKLAGKQLNVLKSHAKMS